MVEMESLGLSQKDAQFKNKWRRELRGQPANSGSPRKMAVKMVCVCALSTLDTKLRSKCHHQQNNILQCFDTVGWATGRASGL